MAKSQVDRKVVLHVGVPKSGTTFLQANLARHRSALREAGVLVPGLKERAFLAALDVRGTHAAWGRRRSEVAGAWDDLCRKARRHDGTTVITHELFAGASVHQVVAALTMLRGLEVHVVVTARDLARQVTAEWQEGVKHGRRLTFEEFRSRVVEGDAADGANDHARRFRASQDLPGVLARWSCDLPATQVHVVCCPPPGGDPGILWERFGDAVGFAARRYAPSDADSTSLNASLGPDEIDLLRRVNVALDRRIVQPEQGELVKRLYAQRLLAPHATARPAVPLEMYDDLAVVGERWVKEIDAAGYVVHGDVTELVPVAPAQRSPHPDEVDPRAQVRSAAAATAELLVELQRTRADVARLEAEAKQSRKRRKALKERLRAATGD